MHSKQFSFEEHAYLHTSEVWVGLLLPSSREVGESSMVEGVGLSRGESQECMGEGKGLKSSGDAVTAPSAVMSSNE